MSRRDGEEEMLHSNEHELSQEPGQASERQLLVGVDTPITPATQYMLRTVGTLFDPYSAHLRLLVLTVIPTPYPAGRSVAPYPLSPTREQRTLGEETLRRVQSLQHDGMVLADRDACSRGKPCRRTGRSGKQATCRLYRHWKSGKLPWAAVPAVAYWQYFAPCRQTCTVPCSGGDSTTIPRPEGSGRLV